MAAPPSPPSPDLDHLFEKIATGEIPSYRIYSDDQVYAFLDINPLSRGHTLVIPRQRSVTLDQLPDDLAAHLGRVLPRITRAVLRATGATACNILQNNGRIAGQLIPHVHFHIIPKYEEDGSGLPNDWPSGPIDKADAPNLARAIANAIRLATDVP